MWTSSDWDPSRTQCFLREVYGVVPSACPVTSDSLCVEVCTPKSTCDFLYMSVDSLYLFLRGSSRELSVCACVFPDACASLTLLPVPRTVSLYCVSALSLQLCSCALGHPAPCTGMGGNGGCLVPCGHPHSASSRSTGWKYLTGCWSPALQRPQWGCSAWRV